MEPVHILLEHYTDGGYIAGVANVLLHCSRPTHFHRIEPVRKHLSLVQQTRAPTCCMISVNDPAPEVPCKCHDALVINPDSAISLTLSIVRGMQCMSVVLVIFLSTCR